MWKLVKRYRIFKMVNDDRDNRLIDPTNSYDDIMFNIRGYESEGEAFIALNTAMNESEDSVFGDYVILPVYTREYFR